MGALDRMAASGVVPVVVIDDAKDAVATAKALLDGGVGVMEITFRTAAAPEAIRAVAEGCPEMTVGAGTVITLEQCKQAVAMGAKFIVSPGFDEEVVKWCVDDGIDVTPGCVTPTEIMAAMKLGLRVLKFFPANVYGGLSALKALSGPFGSVTFIPTGGVNAQNVGEFISSAFVHAVGGSWVCPKADIAAGRFDKITALCQESRRTMLGYEFAHMGINSDDAEAAMGTAKTFSDAFGFAVREGNSSVFASDDIEVVKSQYLGTRGHIAVRTNRMAIAIDDLERKGFSVDMDTAKYKGGRMTAVYLRDEIGGFAVHLMQK